MSASSWLKYSNVIRSLIVLLTTSLQVLPALAQTQNPIYPVSITYQPSIAIPVGPTASGDFNGDGQPDIAYLTRNSVITLLNQGTTTAFTSVTTTLSLSCTPQLYGQMQAADLNNDKKVDLIFACQEGYVVVLFGNGDGTFSQAPSYYSAPNATVLDTPVDLNGDGYLDIALLSSPPLNGPSSIFVLLNKGSNSPGTFATAKSYPAPNGPTLSTIGAGDFNGDGKQDLVAGSFDVGSTTSQLSVYYGTGDGTLQTPQAVAAGYKFATGDFNHDNLTDIAYLASTPPSPNPTSLNILLGSPTGQFTVGSSLPLDPNSSYTGILPAGTADNGQKTVLALSGENILIALGDKSGNFTAGETYDPTSIGGTYFAETGADGKATLVFVVDSGLLFIPGNGDGTFQALPNTDLGGSRTFTPVDLNGDELTDVLTIDAASNLVAAVGRGNGRFTVTSRIPDPTVAGSTTSFGGTFTAGDFNGDGKVDSVYFSQGSPNNLGSTNAQEAFVAGNGNGTFQPPIVGLQLPFSLVGASAAGDFNGDKNLDIVFSNVPTRGQPEPSTLFYLAGKGDGTFAAPVALAQQGPLDTPSAILMGDLNGDGKNDLIWDNAVFLGNGDGTFNRQPLNAFQTPLAIGDLNGDGIPDLVTGGSSYTNIFLGNGDGSFQTDPFHTIALPNLPQSQSALIGDVNADGHADLLVQYAGGQLAILFGDGKGGLTLDTNTYFGGLPAGALALARLNQNAPVLPNDTAPDFLTGSAGGITSLLNQLNPSPTAPAPLPSTTTLTVSANSADPSQQLTFTATVTGTIPTGTVSFVSGTATLGTAPVTNGTASLPYTFTAVGSYTVTATYAGDVANLASTSSPVTVVIAAPDYTISASPTTATITAGQSATSTLTVTPIGGYNGTVKFSCGTLPAGATCTFAPATVTPANGAAATTTLTVTTTAPTTALLKDLTRPLQGIALASLIFLALSPRRTRLLNHRLMRAGFLTLLLTPCLFSISGCSSSSPSNPTTTDPGTPSGAETITVTAADSSGSLSHPINFQVTVN